MALHNIDIEGALRRLADRRIEEAMHQINTMGTNAINVLVGAFGYRH